MKSRLYMAIAAALTCLAMNSAPAFASEPSDNDYLKDTAMLPVKTLAVGSALAIGTPISVIRNELTSIGKFASAWVDEGNSKDGSLPLMIGSLPGGAMSMVGAVGEGLIEGGKNAIDGWDNPFSEKSFSLADAE